MSKRLSPAGRKMTRTIRTGIVAGVVVLATMVLVPTSAVAEPSTPPSGGPTNDQGTTGIRESLDYLMTKYGVSQAEALRRLQLQAHAADLAKAVHGKVGDELLSVWLDQENGGKLTFLTS